MLEFTGERVIPGQVDADLWNEHRARYLFASRLASGKTVLDAGCGAGYGAAELAAVAARVVALDVDAGAVALARREYARDNLTFLQASAASLPLADASLNLVVAFEIVEHIPDWEMFLKETRRVLTPSGQLVISTPNKDYYAETRRLTGPNPYHHREFTFQEFRDALAEVFPHVSMYVQNHGHGIVFEPLAQRSGSELRVEKTTAAPEASHFFLAVCALAPQTGAPAFVFVPSSANVLREREHHIDALEGELATKDAWLEKARAEHAELVELHRQLTEELEQRNLWAESLDKDLRESRTRIAAVQEELAQEQAAAAKVVADYEAKVAELEKDNAAKTAWAQETEQRLSAELSAKCQELADCVDILHRTEKDLEERTRWALTLQSQNEELQTQLAHVAASRWFKLGRTFGLGPEVRSD